jgi:anaerobic selenocysteine-containing dehydrogenase/ferredoxin-NADP reductase
MLDLRKAEIKEGYCTLCRSRCGSLNHVLDGRLVAVSPNPAHPTGAALCAKGRAAPELVESPLRLTKPLKRTTPRGAGSPEWVEIEWSEALDTIAERLGTIRRETGAETVAFAVTTPSGTPMVDSFEWVERFIRCFGSPNLIYAVEICGWHKDYAQALTYGRGIGAADYDNADAIVLWGHNPTRTWLAQATRIAQARKRGATVAVVDPKRGGAGESADLWLGIRPGADGALAMGAIRHLLTNRSYDDAFVRQWTNAPMLVDLSTGHLLHARDLWLDSAADAFVLLRADGSPQAYDTSAALARPQDIVLDGEARLQGADGRTIACASVMRLLMREASAFAPEHVAGITGLAPADLARFYALFEGSPRLAYHSWTGVGQHSNATMIERAIGTLYALTGASDRIGGNVWTSAPPFRAVNDYALLPETQRRKALGLAELPLGPPAKGWITARDFCRSVLEGEPYRVRALMSFGTNFVVSQGDSGRNRAALQALDFHVHVDMFMNPTAEQADIVLPASMPWEREALRLGFEITQAAVEHIQLRQAMVPPRGDVRADYDIAFDLACRLGHGEAFFGGSVEAGWNHQLAPLGLSVAQLRAAPGGIRLPQPNPERKFAAPRGEGGVAGFPTASRRVEIYSEQLLALGHPALPRHVEPASAEGRPAELPLLLSTAKSGWFVHSSHRHVASLRRKAPEPSVELSLDDAKARGIAAGDWVIVRTRDGEAKLRAKLEPTLPAGTVIAEFGWWEACTPLGRLGAPVTGAATHNINAVLSDRDRDPISGSVPLRAVACEIARDDDASRGWWTGERAFRVSSRRHEADDVLAFALTPVDGRSLPGFLPGQHVQVTEPATGLSRSYSLTGPTEDPTEYEIAVRRIGSGGEGIPPGRMSARLHELEPGSLVTLQPPVGVFTPPLTGDRPVILIAAGIGITPFVGYLHALAEIAPERRPPSAELVYICRSGAEQPFGDWLRTIAGRIPELRVVRAFTRPRPQDRHGPDYDHAGRPDIAALGLAPGGRRPLAYLCGPDGFVTETKATLVATGLPGFDVFSEVFVSQIEVPSNLAPRRIVLERSGRSFDWSAQSGSLLDAAEAAGLSLPSGCRSGQCESCRVRVVSGSASHLAAYDGAPDDCLTCCAVPLSDLVLDA